MVLLRHFVIGLIVLSIFITGMVNLVGDLEGQYGTNNGFNTSYYLDHYDVKNDTGAIAAQSADFMTNKSITEGDATESSVQNMWGAIKLLFQTPKIINRLLSRSMADLGVPVWIREYFWQIILITLTFTIVGVFWRSKNV